VSVLLGTVYPAELVADADLTGSTVNLTVTAPDLTTATVADPFIDGKTAVKPILASQVGTYLLVWSISGNLTGGVQDQFTVVPAQMDLISLPDLKDELNLDPANTSKDVKLRRWLKAAADVIENVTGPIRVHTRTDVFDGGQRSVVLTARWVSSVTSVTETYGPISHTLTEQPLGASVDSYGYTWNRATGEITRRGASGSAMLFPSGAGTVTITYVAGLSTIPDDIQLACAELIKHWYRKSEVAFRSGSAFGASASDDVTMPGNYMVPNAVMEILEPWRRPPEIA